MAIELTIAGNTFLFPEKGQDPDWSEDASAWAKAITDAVNTLLGTGDILNSTVTIATNISTATNINGMIFDPGTIRAANVNYAIYRKDINDTYGFSETGTLSLTYDNNAPATTKWTLGQSSVGNSGVSFSVLDSGQVQYTSTNLSGTSYVGILKFNAKTLTQI